MNCGWASQLSFCISRARRDLFSACSCGASFITATVSFKIGSGTRNINDLFVDSLWRELRLRTTVFAGVAIVAQRVMRLPFWCTFRVCLRQFFRLLFPRILTGSPSGHN